MNVIVSNRQKEIIDNANIDAIKDLNGLFNVNDLINKFKNYFFSKMILDATSVVDFASREVLTTLANEIGAEKLIILLPATPEPPVEFKKLLVELKIYNFTNNIDDVIRFIEKSNTYEDAIKLVDNSFNTDVYYDNSIKDGEEETSEEYSNDTNNDDTSNEAFEDINNGTQDDSSMNITSHRSSLGDILNNLNLNRVANNTSDSDTSQDAEPMPEDNYESSEPTDLPLGNNNNIGDNKNVFLLYDDFNSVPNNINQEKLKRIVVGVKNVTLHAGSTSLIYMMHQMASVNLKKEVLSIEVDKNDFRLYRNSKMVSVKASELKNIISNSREEIIFVDLNDCNEIGLCDQVLFLVEPSVIKLNGLMAANKEVFKSLNGEKVILNKSMLSPNDVKTFEGEAGLKFFACVEPLNDRILNDSICKLLGLLEIK